MKRNYRFILLFALCVTLFIEARGQNGFNRVYNFCRDTSLVRSVSRSCYADSNLLLSFGASQLPNVSPEYGHLAALDYSGNVVWEKDMFFPGFRNSSSSEENIVKMRDERFAVIGTILDNSINPNIVVWYPYFYFFYANGDSIRYISYPDTVRIRYFSSLVYHNGHIIAGGQTTSKEYHPVRGGYDYYSKSAWLCKFDTLGQLIWEKSYMTVTHATQNIDDVVVSADGLHYVFAGPMYDTVIGRGGSCMIKIDTAGNITWIKSLPKLYDSESQIDLATDPKGGYYFVSSYSTQPPTPNSASFSHIYYGKLDEQGDTLWTRIFLDSLGYAQGLKISWTPDSNLTILASGEEMGNSNIPVLMRIDTLGNIHWVRSIKHVYNFDDPWYVPHQVLPALSVTPDGRYFLSGYIDANGPMPGYDAPQGQSQRSWFVLADTNGCRYPNDPACWPLNIQQGIDNHPTVRVYPNPANDELHIDFLKIDEQHKVIVTDITGRAVYSALLPTKKNNIDIHHLSAGMYLVKIYNSKEQVQVTKIVKQ